MRQRLLLALTVGSLLTTLLLLRHHIRDLAEVGQTYATFYPYLERHQDILYRFPGGSIAHGESDDNGLVPPVVHQIFLTEGREASITKYEDAMTSCQSLHPNWTHHLWTDERATQFMTEYYSGLLSHYLGYKQSIQRANILRYALLEHFGGVYLDLDVTCLHPLDELRHLPWLTPGAYPAGVNNAFILSRPHHRFTQHLLEGVKTRDLKWGMPYVENMLSTGCMFFSNRWMSYVRALVRSKTEVSPAERVYILADAEGNLDPHMLRGVVTTPLFKHGGASSWHGWDAAAIVLIGKHYKYFLAMMGLGAVFTTVCLIRLSRRRSRRISWMSGLKSLESTDDGESLTGMKEG